MNYPNTKTWPLFWLLCGGLRPRQSPNPGFSWELLQGKSEREDKFTPLKQSLRSEDLSFQLYKEQGPDLILKVDE